MNIDPFLHQFPPLRSHDGDPRPGERAGGSGDSGPSVALAWLGTALEKLGGAVDELEGRDDRLEALFEAHSDERRRGCELFEFAPDAYILTDLYGTIREANLAACTLL